MTRGEIGVLLRVIGEALVVEKGTLSPPEIRGSRRDIPCGVTIDKVVNVDVAESPLRLLDGTNDVMM